MPRYMLLGVKPGPVTMPLTPNVALAPLAVLSSAIGAEEARPEVTRHDLSDRGGVMLVCSDGLTKHVTDAELSDRLAKMLSSQQLCEDLLELALARGGSDNITIVAGRAPKQAPKAV